MAEYVLAAWLLILGVFFVPLIDGATLFELLPRAVNTYMGRFLRFLALPIP